MFLPFCSLEEEGGPEEVLPAVRYVSSARLKGKIYSIGSFNGHLQSKPDDSLNPNPLQWTMVKQTNNFRIEACAVLFENKIVVLGGLNDFHLEGYQSIEIYDPDSDEWTFGPSMSTPRSGHSAVVLNNKIYAIGGGNGINIASVETLDSLDPNASWRPASEMITPRSNFGATVVNNQIMVAGGLTEDDRLAKTTEFYSEETNQWTPSQPLQSADCPYLVTVKGVPNRKDCLAPSSN